MIQTVKQTLGTLQTQFGYRLAQFNDGVCSTNLAGETAQFIVDDRKSYSRAKTGMWGEEPIMEWLLETVGENTVFWDIGAYHGHYSILAALKGGVVLSFEPNRSDLSRTLKNAELNNVRITPKNVALSDVEGTKALSNGVNPEQEINTSGKPVKCVRGESIQTPPDVVKIDVEGHENEVLDGMEETLPTIDRIAVEVHEEASVESVRKKLENAGLHVCMLQSKRSQSYIGANQ